MTASGRPARAGATAAIAGPCTLPLRFSASRFGKAGIDGCPVAPKEVFKAALVTNTRCFALLSLPGGRARTVDVAEAIASAM